MIRYGRKFFYLTNPESERPEKVHIKTIKIKNEHIAKKFFVANISKSLTEKGIDPNTDKYVLRAGSSEAERERQRELQNVTRENKLKKKFKKINKNKLTSMVLEYIINSKDDVVTKEDLAILFKVKEHELTQIYHELNLKGILSQKEPRYAHDSTRNPIFPGSISGWESSIYKIINKEKAIEFLSKIKDQ